VAPLNELLTTRIAKATQLFSELRSVLFVETRSASPNMPQEAGDEQPELLEKLTLLKWIFEARETLHRAIYDLLSDRNDRYRAVVLTPYRLARNADKLASAEAFFAEDAAKRRAAYADEVRRRTCEFRDVVEETVVRGVEAQLSAFWDIAPPLKRLLDAIPPTTEGWSGGGGAGGRDGKGPSSPSSRFGIRIPAQEFAENPSYHAHPLQYLYSLLSHAERSTYQFIEAQANLLCLLHEVSESASVAVAMARARALELSPEAQSASASAQLAVSERVAAEQARRDAESRRLTDDLKEKIRSLQSQWDEALGDAMRAVKERVGEWLLETGGWDEALEDEGVGGVGSVMKEINIIGEGR